MDFGWNNERSFESFEKSVKVWRNPGIFKNHKLLCWILDKITDIKECRTQTYFQIIQSVMGAQILSPNFFKQLKRPSTSLQRVFKGNIDTLDSKTFYARNPNHSRGSSVPLNYVVDIYSSMLKKRWVKHCKTSKFWQK